MDLNLQDKTALVTGSTAGIGLAIAATLAREGARVYINGRTAERVATARAQILDQQPAAKVETVVADFKDKAQVEQLLQEVPAVDILVNNVGVFEPVAFRAITDAQWYEIFEVNVMSGIRLARHYFDGMISRNWGRILFISSESGVQVPPEMIHYGVTKTAQIGLANGLARLTKGSGVTVNTVLPGPTLSEGAGNFIATLAEQNSKSRAEMEKHFFQFDRPGQLLQRFASTQEVANMVAYLASPLASATNGAALRVDGGTLPTIL